MVEILVTFCFSWLSSCFLSFFLSRSCFLSYSPWLSSCFLSFFLEVYFFLCLKRVFFLFFLKSFFYKFSPQAKRHEKGGSSANSKKSLPPLANFNKIKTKTSHWKARKIQGSGLNHGGFGTLLNVRS